MSEVERGGNYIDNMSDEDLIQNAISLAKEFYGEMSFSTSEAWTRWNDDNLALIRILKEIRSRNDWWDGEDSPTWQLLDMPVGSKFFTGIKEEPSDVKTVEKIVYVEKKPETKDCKMCILLKPSTKVALQKLAKSKKTSVNELINISCEEFISRENGQRQ